MKAPNRIELHFLDGHIETVRDMRMARKITQTHPDQQIRIWAVSCNDVGIGAVVDAGVQPASSEQGELGSAIRKTRRRLTDALPRR